MRNEVAENHQISYDGPITERFFIPIGLQRSGTNYLASMMTKNFRATSVSLREDQWKHGYPDEWTRAPDPNTLHIIICKNPYSWIESLMRNSADLGDRRDIETDISSTTHKPTSGLGIPVTHFKYKSGNIINASLWKLITIYNRFYRSWLFCAKQWNLHAMFIRYEDMIARPEEFLEAAHVKIGQPRLMERWVLEHKVGQSRTFTTEMRDAYLNQTKELPPGITPFMAKVINAHLDADLMGMLPYDFIKGD